MALYINDEDVDRLAREFQELTKAPTKTEAVRRALENELARVRKTAPIEEKLAKAKAIADAMGKGDPEFDMKRFTDEMWGD